MRRIVFATSLGLLVWACTPEPQDLDVLLEERLASTSPSNSASGYLLPDSEDLASIPQDPNNPLTAEKVALGQLLYHETGIAVNPKYASNEGSYSCASCHHAAGGFQAGRVQGIAEGGIGFGSFGEGRDRNPDIPGDSLDVQPIRSPSVLNAAYQEVMLWNGQFGATGLNAGTEASWTEATPKFNNYLGYEGVEIQAIAGLTVHRMGVNEELFQATEYQALFDAAFPDLGEDERISLETMGLAIAAYERTILANQAPFQQWLKGDHTALTESQKYGAMLFFDKAGCYSCHNGPSLANMEFHALGMGDLEAGGTYGPGADDATKDGRGGFTG
ncbi:MAG TPA: cytochrome-c peroxidase, partial [Cytophagales bacterium]|nr:cytochrome-c peroxidase [Cytophagales bacterium]